MDEWSYVEIVDQEYGETSERLLFEGEKPTQEELDGIVEHLIETAEGTWGNDDILRELATMGFKFEKVEVSYLVV